MSTLTPRYRARQVANAVNTSTVLGLAVARLGGARVLRGPQGSLLAFGYKSKTPAAVAFTLGNVIITRHNEDIYRRRPELLKHEMRHCTQYAWCIGPVMLPAYAITAGWSWLRTGDFFSRNMFERAAGLVDGGYREAPVRPLRASRMLRRHRPAE